MDNTVGHKVALAFLIMLAATVGLSDSLKKAIDTSTPGRSNITVAPYELFCKKDVGGAGGIYEFLNNTTDRAQGICNVDKGRLAQSEAFVFNEITIGYSKALIGSAGGVDYGTKIPGSLRNAEFEIRQQGRVVLNLPVASLSNRYTASSEAENWTTLGSLCYLTDNMDFTWSFKFPAGESITAGTAGANVDHPYVEVRLRGHKTTQKVLA